MKNVTTTLIRGLLVAGAFALLSSGAMAQMYTAPHDAAWMAGHGWRPVSVTVDGRAAQNWFCDAPKARQADGACAAAGAAPVPLAPEPSDAGKKRGDNASPRRAPVPPVVQATGAVGILPAPLQPHVDPVTGVQQWMPVIEQALLGDHTRFVDRATFMKAASAWASSWEVTDFGTMGLNGFLGKLKAETCDASLLRKLAAVGTLDGKNPVFVSLAKVGCGENRYIITMENSTAGEARIPAFLPGTLAFLQPDKDPDAKWLAANRR